MRGLDLKTCTVAEGTLSNGLPGYEAAIALGVSTAVFAANDLMAIGAMRQWMRLACVCLRYLDLGAEISKWRPFKHRR
jgi:DNA-binding LacI/PurR family transcriptional regulator